MVFSLHDRLASSDNISNGRSPCKKTLWGIWQTNSVPLGSYRVSGIFPTVSRINHSCRPNAHHVWCPERQKEQVQTL